MKVAGYSCRLAYTTPEASRGHYFISLGYPGIVTAGGKDHDRIRICRDPTWNRANTDVSTAIRNGRSSVLPALPQIDISTRGGKVPLLEVPKGVRTGMVAPKLHRLN
jgi:hypothetical protein